MKWLRPLGLLVALAVIYAASLAASRYYAPVFPLGIFTTVAAVGLPAFFAAPLAYRWRLPVPPAWAGVGYCLGSGLATALLMGSGESAGRYAAVALAHAATATVLVPTTDGGYMPLIGNPIWLALAVFVAMYAVDAYRGGVPAKPKS